MKGLHLTGKENSKTKTPCLFAERFFRNDVDQSAFTSSIEVQCPQRVASIGISLRQ